MSRRQARRPGRVSASVARPFPMTLPNQVVWFDSRDFTQALWVPRVGGATYQAAQAVGAQQFGLSTIGSRGKRAALADGTDDYMGLATGLPFSPDVDQTQMGAGIITTPVPGSGVFWGGNGAAPVALGYAFGTGNPYYAHVTENIGAGVVTNAMRTFGVTYIASTRTSQYYVDGVAFGAPFVHSASGGALGAWYLGRSPLFASTFNGLIAHVTGYLSAFSPAQMLALSNWFVADIA